MTNQGSCESVIEAGNTQKGEYSDKIKEILNSVVEWGETVNTPQLTKAERFAVALLSAARTGCSAEEISEVAREVVSWRETVTDLAEAV